MNTVSFIVVTVIIGVKSVHFGLILGARVGIYVALENTLLTVIPHSDAVLFEMTSLQTIIAF
jgi:hypothetical protein